VFPLLYYGITGNDLRSERAAKWPALETGQLPTCPSIAYQKARYASAFERGGFPYELHCRMSVAVFALDKSSPALSRLWPATAHTVPGVFPHPGNCHQRFTTSVTARSSVKAFRVWRGGAPHPRFPLKRRAVTPLSGKIPRKCPQYESGCSMSPLLPSLLSRPRSKQKARESRRGEAATPFATMISSYTPPRLVIPVF
jgi:hypothetical protein